MSLDVSGSPYAGEVLSIIELFGLEIKLLASKFVLNILVEFLRTKVFYARRIVGLHVICHNVYIQCDRRYKCLSFIV